MIDTAAFLDLLDQLARNGHCSEPRPYSGRAMYGKQCVSISGDYCLSEWEIALQIGYLARCFGIDARDIGTPHTDSLGRGTVIYWPRYEWPEDRTAPEEED